MVFKELEIQGFKSFPDKVKIRFDVTLIIIAIVLSFLFFQRLNGVGLGTIVSAILIGPMISFVNRHLPGIEKIRGLAGQ